MSSIRDVPHAGDHGGDAVSIARAMGFGPETMIDLSASMNPFAPDLSAAIAAEVSRNSWSVTAYPNSDAATHLLATAIGVDPQLLVITNGGAEAIALVAAESPIGQVVEPEFSLYRRHLTTTHADAPRWRSNPSSPWGRLAEPTETAGVWDEAFYPLATGMWTRGDADAWRLGSLTKLWNCPGLRLGYVIAPNAAAARLIRHRQPQWAVNGIALALLPELLAQTELGNWQRQISSLRDQFQQALTGVGYAVTATDVNWVLVRTNDPSATFDLRSQLAQRRVVVRDCSSFDLPGTYRVALPRQGQYDQVISAFALAASR